MVHRVGEDTKRIQQLLQDSGARVQHLGYNTVIAELKILHFTEDIPLHQASSYLSFQHRHGKHLIRHELPRPGRARDSQETNPNMVVKL